MYVIWLRLRLGVAFKEHISAELRNACLITGGTGPGTGSKTTDFYDLNQSSVGVSAFGLVSLKTSNISQNSLVNATFVSLHLVYIFEFVDRLPLKQLRNKPVLRHARCSKDVANSTHWFPLFNLIPLPAINRVQGFSTDCTAQVARHMSPSDTAGNFTSNHEPSLWLITNRPLSTPARTKLETPSAPGNN